MSLLEKNWFKNESEKKDLEKVIEEATGERSAQVEELKTEENKYFTEQMKIVRWQLRDIDELIEPTIGLEPQEQNLDRLTSELTGTLTELTERLTAYAKENSDIAEKIDTFTTVSEKLQQVVRTIQKVVGSEELMAEYATQKHKMIKVIVEIEDILTERDDIEESELPPILN